MHAECGAIEAYFAEGLRIDEAGQQRLRDRFLTNTDPRKFPDMSALSIASYGSIAGTTYKAGKAGAQATAQSERTRPWLLANRFQAI